MTLEFIKNSDFTRIIIITSVAGVALVGTPIVRLLIKRYFVKASARFHIEQTTSRFFMNAASFIIWLIAIGIIISHIPSLKAFALTFFASAGIFVAIIGFAAQQAFSNIINGIFIVFSKPFRVGDLIKVSSQEYGIVEDITLRHTIIRNFENKRIIIPNAIVGSETIVNDTIKDSKICKLIEVGISYDSDIELAKRIISEVAIAHTLCIDNRTEEQIAENLSQVEVRLISFDDSSLKLRAYVWTSSPFSAMKMHSDINQAIKKRFDAEGVEIPFPYRTIVYKNDIPKNKQLASDE